MFPVNFVEFLRTPIFIEHLWWLLLKQKRPHEVFSYVIFSEWNSREKLKWLISKTTKWQNVNKLSKPICSKCYFLYTSWKDRKPHVFLILSRCIEIKHTFLSKQLGSGLSAQSCLYFQGFWGSKLLNYYFIFSLLNY